RPKRPPAPAARPKPHRLRGSGGNPTSLAGPRLKGPEPTRLSGGPAAADRAGMGHTTLALFLAAAILVGLFEDSDRERLRGPIHLDRFRIAGAVQIAAVIMLGPWWAALVAAVGTVAAGLFHGVAPR